MSLEEYEILGIVGDITSSTYKVQNKITKAVFMWHAVDYSHMNDGEKQHLLKKLNERKSIDHPHFLKFYNYVQHEDSKIMYISTEFCKTGNLRKLITDCIKNDEGLKEQFIVRILYQICFAFKTSRNVIHTTNLENVFLDDDYNVKLLNFDQNNVKTENKKDIVEFETLISQLCSSNFDDISSLNDCTNQKYYSKEFCLLLKSFSGIIKTVENHQCVDKILCHPTVLLLSSKWTRDTCFYKRECSKINVIHQEPSEDKMNTDYQEIAHKLRKWEATLKMKENKLKEKELYLTNREKKVTLIERSVREKLTQAELYLKRCRETKSSSSGSSKCSTKTSKLSYEHLDTSFSADCGDSAIIPTSRKLNVTKIVKPAPFTRTLSERKVRFKGHSPLKDIDYNRRKPKPILKEYSLLRNANRNNQTLDKITESQSDKSSSWENINKENCRKSRKLFQGKEKFEILNQVSPEIECTPISWTEESKKQAFELLRVMNSAINDKHLLKGEMKHTYL